MKGGHALYFEGFDKALSIAKGLDKYEYIYIYIYSARQTVKHSGLRSHTAGELGGENPPVPEWAMQEKINRTSLEFQVICPT